MEAWDRLQQALRLETPAKNVETLRQEAVACMGDFVGLEPVVWTGFPAPIRTIAVHLDGVRLAVGLHDGTVVLRSLATGAELVRLEKLPFPVAKIHFDPQGRMLVPVYREGTVQVWEPQGAGAWACTTTLSLPPAPPSLSRSSVGALALAADGRHVAAVTHAWALLSALGASAVGFMGSPLGQGPFLAASAPLLQTANPTRVVLWDLADGRVIGQFHGTKNKDLYTATLSPDGRLLAAGYSSSVPEGGFMTLGSSSEGVLVWDVATQELRQTISSPFGSIHEMAFSPDDRLLEFAGGLGFAVFETSQFQRRLAVQTDECFSHTFSPDSQFLAFAAEAGGVVRLWNVSAYREREVALLRFPGAPWRVAFGADGQALIAADLHSLRIWKLAGADEKLVLAGHDRGVNSVVFSPDGTLLASGSRDRTVKIWDPATGQLRKTLPCTQQVFSVDFSPDGQLLAAGGQGTVQFWDARSWQPLPELAVSLGGGVWSIGFSSDGKYIAAGGDRSGLSLARVRYDAPKEAGRGGLTLEDLTRVTTGKVVRLRFSPDSSLLAWVERDYTVRLRDLRTGQVRHLPTIRPAGLIPILTFTPDGQHLLIVSREHEAELWSLASGQKVLSFGGARVPGRTAAVQRTKIALSSDGRRFAWQGGGVSIWDMDSRQLRVVLPEEDSKVWSLGWSANGERLAVGSSDGGLAIWNLAKIRTQLDEIGLGW